MPGSAWAADAAVVSGVVGTIVVFAERGRRNDAGVRR